MSYSNPKSEFLLVISFSLVFPVVGILPGLEQKARRQPNRPPSIDSFTSSLTTIRICPFLPSAAVSDKPEVTLVVTANDPDGDSLHYEYLTTEGTISGEGRSVLWDLNGLKRGPHEVRVRVTDGKGGKVVGTLTVTTTDAPGCDPPPPPCPKIKVSCPDDMHKSKSFIFSATIEEKAKDQTRPSFYWKINAGRIMKGQNSREIEVSTTGANGFENITATVDVAGFDPSCSGTIVSCTTKIIW